MYMHLLLVFTGCWWLFHRAHNRTKQVRTITMLKRALLLQLIARAAPSHVTEQLLSNATTLRSTFRPFGRSALSGTAMDSARGESDEELNSHTLVSFFRAWNSYSSGSVTLHLYVLSTMYLWGIRFCSTCISKTVRLWNTSIRFYCYL